MKSVSVTVINKLGMRARASAKFVGLASQFKCDVTLGRNGQQANNLIHTRFGEAEGGR